VRPVFDFPRFSLPLGILFISLGLAVSGCSMSEEVKRIEKVRLAEQRHAAENTTNLTGEQVFIRSCNTCHPGGRKGYGPSLENINERYPEDAGLKKFIRTGKGLMPGQPLETLNEQELDNLLVYLRAIKPQ